MNWTIPKPPTKDISYYDHTMCETPLGKFVIEWKGWKEPSQDYIIELDGIYIDTSFTLEGARYRVQEYILEKQKELNNYCKEWISDSTI